MFLNIKLKGSALYIAIIISIVTGIVLSLFILIAYFNQRQVLAQLALAQLKFNLNSGFSQATSGYFTDQNNNTWQHSFFNNDSIRIKKLQWGSYEIISVESKNRHQYVRETALYGCAASKDTAMMIADRGRPVGLSGKIVFRGAYYFPKAGIKPAYIEGQGFDGSEVPATLMRQAPGEIPAVSKTVVSNLKKCMGGINPATDSIIEGLLMTMRIDFCARTAVLQTGDLALSAHSLSGNIKLVARGVNIEKTAALDRILIVADKVRIRKGFKGSLHIIASDSIIVEEDCVLDYPSSLTVINRDQAGRSVKGIYLGAGCIIHGALITLGESDQAKVMLKLNKGCEVYGLVYSGAYAQMEGKIFGNAYCHTLMVASPSAIYENHMLNCELDPIKFASSLVIPAIFKTNAAYKTCQWL